jgi:hypothetical protein
MTEVGGGAALYLDPEAVTGLEPSSCTNGVDLLIRALEERSEARDDRVRAGIENAQRFSTDRMIREYISIYRDLVAEKSIK